MSSDETKLIFALAWRALWRHKRRTMITTLSVGGGLTLALFFLSLGEGAYYQLIYDGVRIQTGHVTLEHREYREAPAVDLWIPVTDAFKAELSQLPEVEIVKSLIVAQGVAKSGTGAIGVGVMGVDPEAERQTSSLVKHIVEGEYITENSGAKVVIGSGLAERLKLKVGRKLAISSADINGNLVEGLFRVAGVFKTGVDEMDEFLLQMPLAAARGLFGMPVDGVTQLAVILNEAKDQERALEQIAGLGPEDQSVALPWQTVLPELDAYVKLDRSSNIVFHGILIFIILFTILNTLLMSTLEREKEFAMLLALGTDIWRLRLQTVVEAAFIGLLGCGVGLLLGGGASVAAQIWGLDLSALYGDGLSVSGFAFSTEMHALVTREVFVGSTSLVFVATVLLSVFPMRQIGRKSIVDSLR